MVEKYSEIGNEVIVEDWKEKNRKGKKKRSNMERK